MVLIVIWFSISECFLTDKLYKFPVAICMFLVKPLEIYMELDNVN